MIPSIYQIDFLYGTASALRLLNVGDAMLADLPLKADQAADRYAPIHAPWSESVAKGGASTALDWAVVRDHASHAALHGYCFSHTAAMPSGITGTLRITIAGGDTWQIADVTILSTSTIPRVPSNTYETVTSYTVTGGKIYPVTAIPLYPGIPWDFILQNWDALTGNWETL